ncbi:unnamed protein product [Mytilus edulis]|uniref:Activation-induced cytidine deaminase AID domain-containing protein n=1 Tax=Mytilus edulis TaxID=6550 RepID=A0A8S3R7X5_MYTED|nr:unnamed protein product [Mytilus edulis]
MQQQPYNLPGPSPMSLQQSCVMAPQQPGWEVHRRYEDIMSLNYGRNHFVQKNEYPYNRIDYIYRFKFRGEGVCITLIHGTQYTSLSVGGNGGQTWWDKASRFLDKQCKRLQSGDLQKPGADTGDNKKPLVSEKEFRDFFAIPNVYGTYDLPWPRSTILLYKYSSNTSIKYWEIPENTLKRVDNEPGRDGRDAEEIMIEDLENIQDYLTIQPDDIEGSYKAILSVEVILSYSPCDKCSQSLCLLKETMDKKVKESLSLTKEVEDEEKVKFKITFSNFYKHLEIFDNEHIEGLKNLLRSDIKLDIFSDDNWDYFFNAAGLVTERQKEKGLTRKFYNILKDQ